MESMGVCYQITHEQTNCNSLLLRGKKNTFHWPHIFLPLLLTLLSIFWLQFTRKLYKCPCCLYSISHSSIFVEPLPFQEPLPLKLLLSRYQKTFWTAKDKPFLSYHLICFSSISIIWYLISPSFLEHFFFFFLGLEISITFLGFFLPHCYFQSQFLDSSCHPRLSPWPLLSQSSYLNPSIAFNNMCWMSQIYISVLFSHKLHTCASSSLHDISTWLCNGNLCRCTSKQKLLGYMIVLFLVL